MAECSDCGEHAGRDQARGKCSSRCPRCTRHIVNHTGSSSTPSTTDGTNRVRDAFIDAIEFFHRCLDRDVSDVEAIAHETPREYFASERGWSEETSESKCLGYAPASRTALLDHLMGEGYDRDMLLATGLFWDDLAPIWQGRVVLPYQVDGVPAFAISRAIGHPADDAGDYGDGPAKYHKIPVSRDAVRVEEPIFGLDTIRAGEPVLITEGIADAITAHEAGYPCISPVTTRFKIADRDRLLEVLDDLDVPRVYVIQDAEPPTSDVVEDAEGRPSLSIEQFGEGVRGAVDTATYLTDHGIDARVGELPRPGLGKVDLDDYLWSWAETLDPILGSAKPPAQYSAYAPKAVAIETAARERETSDYSGYDMSAFFDLEIRDATSLEWSYRGPNPLGHHGDSEDYFVLIETYGVAYDHKYKVAYTPLTYLLCEAGEREPASPNGKLSNQEMFVAWRHAREQGLLADGDPIPYAALLHVVRKHELCAPEEIPSDYGESLPAEAYNAALETILEEFGLDPGRTAVTTGGGGHQYAVEVCAPPIRNGEPFDRQTRWGELQGKRLEQALEHDGIEVWADEAGSGKTTNASIGAFNRDRAHALYADKHEKGREFITDDALPEAAEYFHIKGGEQKRQPVCMDVDHAGRDECLEHGTPSMCPSMCPVYDLEKDNPTRQEYEALVPELGPNRTHQLLGLDEVDEYPWHGGTCEWQAQYQTVESVSNVVGVHPYMLQKTVREGRLNIIDETPASQAQERSLSVQDLTRMANTLNAASEYAGTPDGLHELACFARDLINVITNPDGPDAIEALEPSQMEWETYRDVVDPIGGHYVDREHPAESLAKCKVEYGETVFSRMEQGTWEGAPLSIDPLLAAAAIAGLPTKEVMQALAIPPIFEHCPWCRSEVDYANGARICSSDDCDWHEGERSVTTKDGEAARATAWIQTDRKGTPVGLGYRALPLLSELPPPEDTLVLDATAAPEKVACLFGVDRDTIQVTGDEPLEIPNMRITQVLDGQYHASTIKAAVEEDRQLAERIQRTIDTAGQVYERPLFAVEKKLKSLFDFPGNADVLHYHALRGLNRIECDAVIAIGAPHPDVEDLKRDAELLAMGRDDVRVGTEEHSTRRNSPHPPVYRKLFYEDENGRGRAVPTKHYTGLVGTLFRETREKELEQLPHRARPLLKDDDEPVDVFLLTNVPTSLPIDELATFEELADPIRAMLPVSEGAIELLELVRDVAAGHGPAGFRPESLIERRSDGTVANKPKGYHRLSQLAGLNVSDRTVYNWLDELEELGLISPGEYEQREGVSYAIDLATLQSALSVLSGNGRFKVAAVRRFRALVETAEGSLDWLGWAREVLALRGDRCRWPNRGGSPSDDAR